MRVVPELPRAKQEPYLREAFQDAYKVGVTSIHDVGSARSFAVFQSLYAKGTLGLRVLHALPVQLIDEMTATPFRSGFGDEFFRLGAFKVFLDGALGSHTAHLKKPYTSNTKDYGVPVYTAREFTDLVGQAFQAGWAIAVHAIGDAAVRRALDGFKAHRKRMPKQMSSRIEHAQLLDPADIPLFAECGIAASVQPSHLLADRDTAIKHWGTKRSRWAYAFKSLRDAGISLVLGSDTPIERLHPIEGIHAAVNRSLPGDTRGPWTRAEMLSVHDAVFGFTQAAADASGESSIKGSITPGKIADFVVLSDNIFETERRNIMNASVVLTVFNGRIVYSAI
jgi:predicted amidohydrolase YtcJ